MARSRARDTHELACVPAWHGDVTSYESSRHGIQSIFQKNIPFAKIRILETIDNESILAI